MLIEGQFTLRAPIQQVWKSLLDPQTLGSCVPGTERMETINDTTYESIVRQRVGPIKVKFMFTTSLTELRPPNFIKAVGRGVDATRLGNFTSEVKVNLTEIGPDAVKVAYEANISLVGRLAAFGERLMRAKANEVGEEFSRKLREKLQSKSAATAAK